MKLYTGASSYCDKLLVVEFINELLAREYKAFFITDADGLMHI